METTQRYKHSILDFYGCSKDILESPRLGIKLVKEVCREAGLNIVGTFSKRYTNGGYSCGAFLSESHFSLHTWPERSYCAVDIFVCRGNIEKAESILSERLRPNDVKRHLIERGKGIDVQEESWVHSNRSSDYFEAYKSTGPVLKEQSRYQTIEIFDNPSFGKVLLIDGDIQLSSTDERIYHEYLVHPALLAHRQPQKVLLLGGGDGGALREIVKHDDLKSIVMVEIDEEVVRQCRKALPDVNRGAFVDSRVREKDRCLRSSSHRF